MFKGNQDSSDEQNQLDNIPRIDKSLVIDPQISVDHIICAICYFIIWDPVVCGDGMGCHNSFCKSCINSWLNIGNKVCPTCKKLFIFGAIPPILGTVLNSLMIQCINLQNGCTQKLYYQNLNLHLKQCQFKIQKCKGCKKNIIKKNYQQHIISCDQFVVQCQKCKSQMIKAVLGNHSRIQCFSKQIQTLSTRLTAVEHDIEEITNSIDKLENLTSCFISGEALQMNIELYTTFNQHFIFPNPTLIKPSFNEQKQKYQYLHFYVLNPIYTDSIVSIKWGIKITRMNGNILIGFCSSITINSLDYAINKYGDLKRKNTNENKYKLINKNDGGFIFNYGDVIKFKYLSFQKCIQIWNQTKKVGMMLGGHQIQQLGEKIFIFFSMDTLNDSISFI